MKLVFDKDFEWAGRFDSTWTTEELANAKEFFNGLYEHAKSVSLGPIMQLTDKGVQIRIYGQKVSLDENAMNALLVGVLSELWAFDVVYSPDGVGCDFSIRIEDWTPHCYGGVYEKDFQP